MHFPDGNHPCKSFSAYQDQFPRWKSSLQELFCISGCISPLEIIPARAFLHIRINFSAGNHPSQTFPANQDAFPRWKSSLPDISCKSGCISPLEIIPPTFLEEKSIGSSLLIKKSAILRSQRSHREREPGFSRLCPPGARGQHVLMIHVHGGRSPSVQKCRSAPPQVSSVSNLRNVNPSAQKRSGQL